MPNKNENIGRKLKSRLYLRNGVIRSSVENKRVSPERIIPEKKMKSFYASIQAILLLIMVFILFIPAYSGSSDAHYPDILTRMKERFEKIETYQCFFQVFTAKGKKTETVTARYYFKQPKMVRMEILEGSQKGAILLYKPHSVRLKPGKGLLSIFHFKLEPENDSLVDLRGYGIHETDWGYYIDQHLQRLEMTSSQFAGEENIEGRKTLVFELLSQYPERSNDVAKELLWIDKEELIPLKYVHYDTSGMLILSAQFKDIKINVEFEDSFFERFKKDERDKKDEIEQ
jgi:outer membrane lipoprotein-sorting protein